MPPVDENEQDDEFGEIENIVRLAVPRDIPPPLRARIIAELSKEESKRLRLFPWLAAAAAIGLGVFALLKHDSSLEKQPTIASVPVEQVTAEFIPLSEMTTRVALRPVGSVVDAGGYPLRLFESHEIVTREFQDPDTGEIIKVSSPTMKYQIGRPEVL